ncbi:MAG: ATP-binding cassette domain-containing protein [Clostridia bacterium]|jgi:ATPase subunit of ABC transporter with duplicated ATPase domains
MLQITDLSIILNKDERELIKDFSFSLNKGDKAVIIGEEGNGKSTLLKLLYDEKLITDYARYKGAITKTDTSFGYLSQGLSDYENMMTCKDFMEADSVSMDIRKMSLIAKDLGIEINSIYSDRLMHTWSGGEKVKLQFLRMLQKDPDILLLDEPTNDIDIGTLEWLEHFINTCGLPVIFVSHDETLIENTANVIIHLEQQKKKTVCSHTIARTGYKEYIERRENDLRKQDQTASKQREEYKEQISRWRKIHDKVEHDQNTISRQDPSGGRLLKKKMKTVISLEKRFEKQKQDFTSFTDTEDAMLMRFCQDTYIPHSKYVTRTHIDKLYGGDMKLSENIDLNVSGDEHIGIIGQNGAGKTTLIKLIIAELSQKKELKLGYMPQNYEDEMDLSLSCMGFLTKDMTKDEITKARTYMGGMKFTHEEMAGRLSDLSGGQKAKIFFLDMILRGCNVLVLDEPTRNFSPLSNPVIRKTLKAFKGAIISVSHDRKYLNEVCDKIYRLSKNGLTLTDHIC